ncbi:MAG: LytTR family DNA-binding domain-containing protein [Saprospiraceae bacterium]|nr:LytTR family DNA-binding domain-containing protein [Saprospiraceae bacterium]
MKCLIVDDEPYAVDLLTEYIQQTPFLQLAGKCYNAVEALSFLQKKEADLIFLDINLPQLSGMQLAGLLADKYQIIFTTAYSEYAVESYELNAIDYLLKPITFERFIKSAQKARSILNENKIPNNKTEEPTNAAFFVKTGKAVVKLCFEKIHYIEALGDYAVFHLQNEKHVVYKRMKELEATLPEQFCRIHNSYIVNMNHIIKIEDKQIYIGSNELPISEKYHFDFWERVQARLFK